MQEEVIEKGIVINSKNGFIDIELLENDNCEECSAKLYCSSQKDSTKTLTIKNPSNYSSGDKVTISILGRNILKAAFKLYLYPLILLVGSIFIGTKMFAFNAELYSFLLGILIVALYYILFYHLGKKVKNGEPEILVVKTE
jgi:positive regulator of sigma E activity